MLALLPLILNFINSPAGRALMPLITQVLAQLGSSQFPGVDPAKAETAGAALFDVNATKWVQTALNVVDGAKLTVDGVHGQATIDAVKKFQTAHNLTVDGWAGELTSTALRNALVALPGSK